MTTTETITHRLSEDGTIAEQQAIKLLNEATATLTNTQALQTPVLETEPSAFGLSPEFVEAETRATSAGIVWTLDDDGYFQIQPYQYSEADQIAHTGHWSLFGTYWCDTCNSPYCENC